MSPSVIRPATMNALLHHLRVSSRVLRRAPGFTLAVIGTLSLGIGLATAVFSVADAILLRPLPVVDQGRVVVFPFAAANGQTTNYPLNIESTRDYVRRSRTLSAAAYFAYEGAAPKPMRDGDRITSFRRALVSGNYFKVLGAVPFVGRTLNKEDDVIGATPAVVLSYHAWQTTFGAARDIVGRRVVMHDDGLAYTVVGVMAAGLDYPRGVDGWATINAATPAQNLANVAVNVIGRLANTATIESARDEMTQYHQRADAPQSLRAAKGAPQTLAATIVGNTKPAVLAFSVAAILLLLITCVNVANLQLVRSLGRTREFAVRFALGASKSRLIVQLMAEQGLLAVTGCVMAICVAAVSVRLFTQFAPSSFPHVEEISVNGAAIVVAICATIVAMVLTATAPALLSTRLKGDQELRVSGRQAGSRTTRLFSEFLVAGQIALALLMLSGALLVGRSLVNLQNTKLSFEPSQLMVAELSLRVDSYGTAPKQLEMLSALLPAVQSIPGVVSATPVVAVPFSVAGWDATPSTPGQTADQVRDNPLLNMELASPEYFQTMGLRILDGRAFNNTDRAGAQPVVILSESAAHHYWPDANAVGKIITMGSGTSPRVFTVVGVVPDTRYRDLRIARSSIYFPLQQSFFPFAPTTLILRTSLPLSSVVPALRRVLESTAPGVALTRIAPFDTFMETPLALPRLNTLLLSVFATTAVVLAAVGLFGVMATMVQKRTHEFGLRMALGATSTQVGALVLRRGVTLAAVGSLVGLVAAVVLNRTLAAMLFEVSPTDLTTLVATVLMLTAIAAFASVLPALRGTRISPTEAMRAE